jgi:hypothetical protein
MMRSANFYSILVALALTGCASTYKQEVLNTPAAKLLVGKSVLIATPTNGSYGGKEYAGSGATTASAVRSAFSPYSNDVIVSADCKDLNCLKVNATSSYHYYVVPQIFNWEDRATEWSGKKDKIQIKISVYDGSDGHELSSSIISGKSKWGTFGGDHPQDLLPEPISSYVKSLY